MKASTGRNELAAAIKTARDVMRKDAGLSGDLDRTPQLAWLLFLKAFDDLERKRALTERQFRPAIDAPYRWRDWAADPVDGRTGQVLLDFVNGELLPYLRELRGTGSQDPRDVLAAVFPQELLEDQASRLRRVQRVPGMVGRVRPQGPRRDRARLEGPDRRHRGRRLQPRPQEPKSPR